MSSSVALIVVGTVLIAIGGVVATLGWNSHADDKRRQGLIEQVAAELAINLNILNYAKFKETDPTKLDDFAVFPRFQTVATDAAISSGLFLKEADRELLTRLSGLSELFRDFNNRLGITEAHTLTASAQDRIRWRNRLRDGATRDGIGQKLRLLGKLLIERYEIDRDHKFFVELGEDAA